MISEALQAAPLALTFRPPPGVEDWWPRPELRVTLLRPDNGCPVELPAVVDTGAVHSTWPRSFAERLGISIERDCDPAERRGDFAGQEHPAWRYRGELAAQIKVHSFPWRGEFIETTNEMGLLGGDFFMEFDLSWERRRDWLRIVLFPIPHPERKPLREAA